MTRIALERHQLWIYLAALASGGALGLAAPAAGGALEPALWPALAALLYATFCQVPLTHLRRALQDTRFMAALFVANFAAVPLVVWAMASLLPDDPALRLGVYLVMLVPCTDWFNTFNYLGGGDARLGVAATPLLLLAQFVLLPAYLLLFMGASALPAMGTAGFLQAFVGLILLPLAAAFATERWALRHTSGARALEALGWAPVPLLALTLLLIAASQIDTLRTLPLARLGEALALFVAYVFLAAWIGRMVARRFGLTTAAARTVVFSAGTRNSFVVLPLALALPAGWEIAVAVIVLQSVVELFGMLCYLRWVPRRLLPDPGALAATPRP
ncbi:MAG: arsenic resistance protein [Pseudomonadota bacterium]